MIKIVAFLALLTSLTKAATDFPETVPLDTVLVTQYNSPTYPYVYPSVYPPSNNHPSGSLNGWPSYLTAAFLLVVNAALPMN